MKKKKKKKNGDIPGSIRITRKYASKTTEAKAWDIKKDPHPGDLSMGNSKRL